MDPRNEGHSINMSSMHKDAHPMGDSEDHRKPTRIQGMLQDFDDIFNGKMKSIEIKAKGTRQVRRKRARYKRSSPEP